MQEDAARDLPVDADALRRAQAAQRNWSVGAEGERLVAATLADLAPHGWTALHDMPWPGRERANIDHIAFGPGGIVVIDSKNWSGRVAVAEGSLRQNSHQRASSAVGVSQAAADITSLFPPQHRTAVRAVLCLAAQDQAPTPVKGVDVVGRAQLAAYLQALPPRMPASDVERARQHAEVELRRAQRLEHFRPSRTDAPSRHRDTTVRPPRVTAPRPPGRGHRPVSSPTSRARSRRPADVTVSIPLKPVMAVIGLLWLAQALRGCGLGG